MFDNDTYDLVMCRECGFTCEHLSSHLKSAHGLKSQEYKEKHPGAPIICQRRNDNFRKNNPAKTDEFKKKHSERMSGENHPFYGKHHTEEMKKIISESLMGEKHPLYGKHHKEESRKKMSEKRQGEDNPMYGKAGFGGKKHTQESKDKIAEKRAEFLSTSGYDPNARTNIELICRELLNSIGAEFQEQYKLSKFVYDFHIGGKFIEVNGDYWHCHPKMYTQSDPRQSVNIKRDKEKLDKVGQENMLYLWEDDLLHRPEICYRLIKSFLSGEHVPLHSYEVERRAITHE